MTQQAPVSPYMRRKVGEYAFPLTDKVIVGQGTIARLRDEVERLGRSRAFVVTGT